MQKDSTVFSIIIDMSQGMALDRVIVKCQNCSQLGQILMGVARTTLIDGPSVFNLNKNFVILKVCNFFLPNTLDS